jgi:polysaccharide pyruvyl transferase WcaK-like protein
MGMRILLDQGDYAYHNVGTAAMLQGAVASVREAWPSARIQVLTEDPETLAAYCPGTEPVPFAGHTAWFADRELLNPVYRVAPAPVSRALVDATTSLRESAPSLFRSALRLKMRARRRSDADLLAFLDAMDGADAVASSGQGSFADHSRSSVIPMLQTIEGALARGIAVAVFGLGAGPLTDPELVARARAGLPRAAFVGVREGRTGPGLMRSLGVPADRIVVTGDAALTLPYSARRVVPGSGIGVNLRIQPSSAVGKEMIGVLRPALQAFASARGAELVALPGSRRPGVDDPAVIREMLAGYDDGSDGGERLGTPRQVIEEAGRCRLVITGAYHIAVFALAQGIPAICMGKSSYFMTKFLGLVKQFGPACQVMELEGSDLGGRLTEALRSAWDGADGAREPLLAATLRQIDDSRAAYRRFAELAGNSGRKRGVGSDRSFSGAAS